MQAKKVLHLGCTDWPLTKNRLENGDLLHHKLAGVCDLQVGADPDDQALNALRRFLPHRVFHTREAEEMHENSEIIGTSWDVILAADVVEHLSNLGAALDSIALLMQPNTELLITTPSAFSLKRFVARAFTGTEHVHPDLCYYFSPSTLTQLFKKVRA